MGLVARLQFPTELETVLVREITTAVICLTSWRDSSDGRPLMAATGIRLIVIIPLRYCTTGPILGLQHSQLTGTSILAAVGRVGWSTYLVNVRSSEVMPAWMK